MLIQDNTYHIQFLLKLKPLTVKAQPSALVPIICVPFRAAIRLIMIEMQPDPRRPIQPPLF